MILVFYLTLIVSKTKTGLEVYICSVNLTRMVKWNISNPSNAKLFYLTGNSSVASHFISYGNLAYSLLSNIISKPGLLTRWSGE